MSFKKLLLMLLILLVPLTVMGAGSLSGDRVLALKVLIAIVIVTLGLLLFIFWLFMLIDCIQRDFKTKFRWLLILTLVPFSYFFYYFMIKRRDVHVMGQKNKHLDIFSVLSIALAIISFFALSLGMLAIILGIVSKIRIKQNPKLKGVELAKAGIVLGVVSTVLFLALIIAYFFLIAFLISGGLDYEPYEHYEFDDLDVPEWSPDNMTGLLDVGSTVDYEMNNRIYQVELLNVTTKPNRAFFSVNGDEFSIGPGGTSVLSDGTKFRMNYVLKNVSGSLEGKNDLAAFSLVHE